MTSGGQFVRGAMLTDVTTVWITCWEMQCCGEPFAVGDYVEWPAKFVERSDWLERLFSGTRVVVDFDYQAHAPVESEAELTKVAGVVENIEAVSSPMMRTPIDARADLLEIIEGGAVRRPLVRAGRSLPADQDCDDEFVGYLVTLAT